ncbi:glycoside hydrolase family 108 protein [Kangiella shandongensis]|uniref:glycoside hydrolase family 108 protein n=1 Tax=Kangiella shandongensis TaxID=2763258 RepID=UPI001CBFA268|nr:glycosyl hydrolase 108 family protein [Kangiella shandongensis]
MSGGCPQFWQRASNQPSTPIPPPSSNIFNEVDTAAVGSSGTQSTPEAPLPSAPVNSATQSPVTIQSGDTLGALGDEHGFDWRESQIKRDGQVYEIGPNGIPPEKIRPGDQVIPGGGETNSPVQNAEQAAEEAGSDSSIEESTSECPCECDYKKFFWEEVLGHEGGYVDDPVDRGGKTKYGVTINTWRRYSQRLFGIEASEDTLRDLTPDQAFEIFRVGYWEPSGADQIENCELAFQIADIAYNSGSGNSTKILQRAINDLGGDVTVDGAIGPQTLNAANNLSAPELYVKVRERRIRFYEAIIRNDPSQAKYRNGWKNRANSFDAY